MLSCQVFFDALTQEGIAFYAGVPDSLLKHFCAYVTDNAAPSAHVITANEGGAVGLAAGHYLATGQTALVYMQNSGLGNTVNPLTSLADSAVYGIPMLLVVGWRGEPGTQDEPQHVKMGGVTCSLFDAIGVPYAVLDDELEGAKRQITEAVASARTREAPFALLVRKGTFESHKLETVTDNPYLLTRERAVECIAEALGTDAPIVSTTGKPSRELFETREQRGEAHHADFLTVGSMGHASQIAFGAALSQDKPVYCLDGDGAAIMHLGGFATIGSLRPKNFKHILLNNGAHDSVGGQPTVGFEIDFCRIASACGYPLALRATTEDELRGALQTLRVAQGPALLEVRVARGARADLGRPTVSPQDAKRAFRTAFE